MSVKTYAIGPALPFQVLSQSVNFAIVHADITGELRRAEVLLEHGFEILYPLPGYEDTYLTRRKT